MCPPRGEVCVHCHEYGVCVHSTRGSRGLRSQYIRSCGHDAQAAQSAGSSFTTSSSDSGQALDQQASGDSANLDQDDEQV